MNQIGFLSPSCPLTSLLFYIICFSLVTKFTLFAVDPQFEACRSQNQTCGDGQNISFPFYILGQESYCGYPGFEVSCNKNGNPILKLSDTQYIIRQIFYNNQSLRVSNAAFSMSNTNEDACIGPTQNISFPTKRFKFDSSQNDIFLFYDCNSSSLPKNLLQYAIGCPKEKQKGTVLALYGEELNFSYAYENCKGGMVETKVEGGFGNEIDRIGEALRRGFVLKWTASDCNMCTASGGWCGFNETFYQFKCYCPDRPHSSDCSPVSEAKDSRTMNDKRVLKLGLGASIAVVGLMLIIICFCFRRKLSSLKLTHFWKKSQNHNIKAFLRDHGPISIRRYNYSDIRNMTSSFKDKLGQGGYGNVYKGKLPDGCPVAVKVLSESKGNGEDFINEVASISRTSHVNIVTLLGFCFKGSKRALVYEFMPNGSLEKFIYEENQLKGHPQLDCETLFRIAIGVAKGLEYLHKGCNTRILHFDIKPHNILLNEDFCPKISDFGLSKICPRKESIISMLGARGTAGYIAPEVFSRNFGGVSHKSDVYSYGMMILEMVGGRKNINAEADCTSEINFPHWIYKHLELNEELALQSIRNEGDKERMRKMIMVGLWCIQTDPSSRPTMGRVVEMLEGSLESLQVPPKPFLSSPRSPAKLSTQMSDMVSVVP